MYSLWKKKPIHTVGQSELCVVCKGARLLCGKPSCPLMVRAYSLLRATSFIKGSTIEGCSPPSVFVGRIGYPKVYFGPLVPPVTENTAIFDFPEVWFGKPFEEIVGFRSLLVRGKYLVHVRKFEEARAVTEAVRGLAFSSKDTYAELHLKKEPRGFLTLSPEAAPYGPSAIMQSLKVNNTSWDHRIERAYYDEDLKAVPAVCELYQNGVPVSKIQRAFSIGAFGLKDNRCLVPTRWSITAIDDMVSKSLLKSIRRAPTINEYRVYKSDYLDNKFGVLMLPDVWSFEVLESWSHGSLWNPYAYAVLSGDRESYSGRTTYAGNVGGAYYAARLGVCERLHREGRQAATVVFREIQPGYIIPLGVWQIRENVRNAMRSEPAKFGSLEQALQYATSGFKTPLPQWLKASQIVRQSKIQKKLLSFLK